MDRVVDIKNQVFLKLWRYIECKRPSPYLLEHLYYWFASIGVCCIAMIIVFIICLLTKISFVFVLVLTLPSIPILIMMRFLSDHAGWLYLLDKYRKQIVVLKGEIWETIDEDVNVSRGVEHDSNKIHYFYKDELAAVRRWLYYRHQEEAVSAKGSFGDDLRPLVTKRGDPLKRIRMVLTIPKYELLEKFVELCPSIEVEMVCWKQSKILIKFRPVEGVEYPPEALEYLEQINAMYP